MMETNTKSRFEDRKKMILAVCVLTAGWLVMAVNAEDKQSKKNQKIQGSSAVLPETKRSVNEIKTISYPELTKHELKIQEALNTETECDFSEIPLSKAMELLAERHGITILVMLHHLEEEGLSVDEPVSLSVKGISLKNALDLMLEPNHLTYVVDQDVLKITTRVMSEDESEYKLRVYPVGDFGDTPEGYLELMDIIQTSVLEYDNSVSLISSSKSLVISLSYHEHITIVDLLTQLRQARAENGQ